MAARRLCEHDCRSDRLGLTDGQLASLTGFTGRAACALAHLREAWAGADDGNRRAVEAAIRALLEGHSMQEKRSLWAPLLSEGLGQATAGELLSKTVQAVPTTSTKPGVGPRCHPTSGMSFHKTPLHAGDLGSLWCKTCGEPVVTVRVLGEQGPRCHPTSGMMLAPTARAGGGLALWCKTCFQHVVNVEVLPDTSSEERSDG